MFVFTPQRSWYKKNYYKEIPNLNLLESHSRLKSNIQKTFSENLFNTKTKIEFFPLSCPCVFSSPSLVSICFPYLEQRRRCTSMSLKHALVYGLHCTFHFVLMHQARTHTCTLHYLFASNLHSTCKTTMLFCILFIMRHQLHSEND